MKKDFETAIKIRAVEENFLEMFSDGLLNGTVHTCIGQELSAVGITKFFGEQLLINNKINCINLRLPGILCIKNNKKYPIISRLLEDLKKNKQITLVNKNAKFNNVVDTFEISKLIEKIILYKKKLKTETFNVCASKPIKLHKVLSMLMKKTNSKSKINYFTKKNYSYSISFNKLKKFLNFYPSSTEKIIERNLYSRYS